jgi:uncharacterized protein involved in exopolysaccharide biosynthesis
MAGINQVADRLGVVARQRQGASDSHLRISSEVLRLSGEMRAPSLSIDELESLESKYIEKSNLLRQCTLELFRVHAEWVALNAELQKIKLQ